MKTIEITQDLLLTYTLVLDGEGRWTREVEDNKYIQLQEWQRKYELLQQELYEIIQNGD